jgi:hypothetical protein
MNWESIRKNIFLQCEILKRHFETNAPIESINWLKDNCFKYLVEDMPINRKIILVRTSINFFSKIKKGEGVDHLIYFFCKSGGTEEDVRIIYELMHNEEWISKMLFLSEEYGVYAPYLMCPYDMYKMIDLIKNKDYIVPYSDIFEKEDDDPNSIYEKYGYTVKDCGNCLTIEIDFENEHPLQEHLVEKIANEISMYKISKGMQTSEYEDSILIKISKEDANFKMRVTSFDNRLIGLFAWDMKNRKDEPTFKAIRNELLSKDLYQYKNNQCKLNHCNNCEYDDDCIDSIEGFYKIAAKSIKEKGIVPSSLKIGSYYPDRKIIFDRFSPEEL